MFPLHLNSLICTDLKRKQTETNGNNKNIYEYLLKSFFILKIGCSFDKN